jgi:hypothetical protein
MKPKLEKPDWGDVCAVYCERCGTTIGYETIEQWDKLPRDQEKRAFYCKDCIE